MEVNDGDAGDAVDFTVPMTSLINEESKASISQARLGRRTGDKLY